jgi:hypothetical protein
MPSARTPFLHVFFSPQRLRRPRKGQRHFQVKQPAFNFADLARDFRKSVGEQSLKTPLTLRSFLENEIAHKPGAPPAVRGEAIVLSDGGCETGLAVSSHDRRKARAKAKVDGGAKHFAGSRRARPCSTKSAQSRNPGRDR